VVKPNKYLDMIEKLIAIAEDAKEGNTNALKAYVELKGILEAVNGCIKDIKDLAMDEASKYGKGEHKEYGVTFQVKNGAGRWSYKGCLWNEDVKKLQEQAKAAYKQSINNLQLVDDQGEIVTPATFTAGGEVLTISFKK
jgi:hypothetical protein